MVLIRCTIDMMRDWALAETFRYLILPSNFYCQQLVQSCYPSSELFFKYLSGCILLVRLPFRRQVATSQILTIEDWRQNSLAKCLSQRVNAQFLVVHLAATIGYNGNSHMYKRWCCWRGRPILVPYLYLRGHRASLRRANYSYYCRHHFLKL